MTFCCPSHPTAFHGLPVHDFPTAPQEARPGPPPAPGAVARRIACAYEEDPFDTLWRRLCDEVRTEEVTALVIGPWRADYDEEGIGPVLELITADADRFPALRAVFLGDVEAEEFEISWIGTGLRHLGLRNSDIQNDIAAAPAGAPVVDRPDSLDLSTGALDDEGGEALLLGQPLTHLGALNLNHHFRGEPVVRRLRETPEPHGVCVTLEAARHRAGRTERHVAVSE